ncbi:hypothetical protein BV20DRAFT_1121053 [Pilatotrama ljubarskyi]|nr:hypothetical protein BV20DRAFT_1121053 [Pilatotrama ljubarskyi]
MHNRQMSSPFYDPLWPSSTQGSAAPAPSGSQGSGELFGYDPSFEMQQWSFPQAAALLPGDLSATEELVPPLEAPAVGTPAGSGSSPASSMPQPAATSDVSKRYETRSATRRQVPPPPQPLQIPSPAASLVQPPPTSLQLYAHPPDVDAPGASLSLTERAATPSHPLGRPTTEPSLSIEVAAHSSQPPSQQQHQEIRPQKRKRGGGRRSEPSTAATPHSRAATSSAPSVTSSQQHTHPRQAADVTPTARSTSGAGLPPPRRRGGRRRGVMNFSSADVTELLRLVRSHMPIGMHGWERVCAGYNAYASTRGRPRRDVQSLRTKYYKLVNVKKPTGDPDCPPDVREAKRIEREIERRVCLGIVDDDPIPPEWEADRDVSPDSDGESDSGPAEEVACGGIEEGGASEGIDSDSEPDGNCGNDTRPRKRCKAECPDQASWADHKQSSERSTTRADVALRHRQRASSLLAALEEHLDPRARAEREAAREQSRVQRLEMLANVLASRDDRAELRELRRRVEDLSRERTELLMENSRLQNELRIMQMMLNFGLAQAGSGAPISSDSGYADDVSDSYSVSM